MLSPEVICLKRPYEINFLSFGMAFDHSPAALTSSHAFVYDSMFGSVDRRALLLLCQIQKGTEPVGTQENHNPLKLKKNFCKKEVDQIKI